MCVCVYTYKTNGQLFFSFQTFLDLATLRTVMDRNKPTIHEIPNNKFCAISKKGNHSTIE